MSNTKKSSVIFSNGRRNKLKFNPNANYELMSPEQISTRAQQPTTAAQWRRL